MGYYAQFPMPIPHLGAHSISLLTLPPLTLAGPFDLHVLAMPPAFSLSQNQTLQLKSFAMRLPSCDGNRGASDSDDSFDLQIKTRTLVLAGQRGSFPNPAAAGGLTPATEQAFNFKQNSTLPRATLSDGPLPRGGVLVVIHENACRAGL